MRISRKYCICLLALLAVSFVVHVDSQQGDASSQPGKNGKGQGRGKGKGKGPDRKTDSKEEDEAGLESGMGGKGDKGDEQDMGDMGSKDEDKESDLDLTSAQTTITTTTPGPTKPSSPTLMLPGNRPLYQIVNKEGKVCLKATLRASFSLRYSSVKTGKDTVYETDIDTIPTSATVDGECGTDKSTLKMSWANNNYTLKIDFRVEPNNLTGANGEIESIPGWIATEFQFTFDTNDKNHFDHPIEPGVHSVRSKVSEKHFWTPRNKSFTCASTETFKLFEIRDNGTVSDLAIKSAKMDLWAVQIQAFDVPTSNSKEPFSQATECATDIMNSLPHNNIVPLIVAACLAAVILIIIIAYFVTRNMSNIGYKSVE